ncbi:MAG: type I DNA topoisomerase [Acholeplasmatales bacterium]|nr:type I DNA topoisomerase [Acholeplasmatales bacterium]
MSVVIIVESPSKSKTIGTYLGKGYNVLSSKGHICDLAITGKDGLGIDIDGGFVPQYTINSDKRVLVDYLKKECKGKTVLLATDPDREGEAIAYHLARELGLSFDDANRIEFHEITKTAVNEALNSPKKIDLKMVDSQEARRMIDRILGFKLSKLLQRKINSKSAGRVQSVALMLIVNLEKEILAFIPTQYFEIEALYKGNKIKLNSIGDRVIDSKNRITDRKELEDLKDSLGKFNVNSIEKKTVKRQSQPTFTTSTLQQDASNKLNFNPTKTMTVAQTLYEGKNIGSETVGLITYMRTDSTRLADTFVNEVKSFISDNYGKNYVGYVKSRNQKNMQDAHEGIRPTSISRRPDDLKEYLTNDEYKLYKLIYNRTLASLMAASEYDSTKIILTNTNSTWSMQGSMLKFDGYLKVYDRDDKDEKLPQLKEGDSFDADSIEILDKETEPKSRFTEASLIKEMEDLGIGRPSTYAMTIQTLKDRGYVKVEKKVLIPTDQGILTTEKLLEFFSKIINVKYTANMETDLDKIAKGEKDRNAEMNEFYDSFIPLFENAKDNMEKKYPILLDETCPECGKPLVIRLGRYGEFVSCSNYPYCSYIKKDTPTDIDTHILCPVCGKSNIMQKIAKSGKNKGKVFYACGNYPKCRTTYSDEPTNELCPNCGSMMLLDPNGKLYCSKKCQSELTEVFICPTCKTGHIEAKIAKRGKNAGNTFYACSNYPKCKTILNGKPTKEICPNCGSMMVIDASGSLVCNNRCDETNVINTEEVLCPKCNKGHLIERKATRGKNAGNIFYGCSNYPRCKNVVTIEEYQKLKK